MNPRWPKMSPRRPKMSPRRPKTSTLKTRAFKKAPSGFAGSKNGPKSSKKQIEKITPKMTSKNNVFGTILGSIFTQKSIQKHIFFERLLEPVWSHLGKLLGCLRALLGGLECYPGTTLQQFWHIFKNEDIRCLSFLGRLLESILAHFGPIWTPRWSQKSLKNNPKQK